MITFVVVGGQLPQSVAVVNSASVQSAQRRPPHPPPHTPHTHPARIRRVPPPPSGGRVGSSWAGCCPARPAPRPPPSRPPLPRPLNAPPLYAPHAALPVGRAADNALSEHFFGHVGNCLYFCTVFQFKITNSHGKRKTTISMVDKTSYRDIIRPCRRNY